MRRRRSRRSRCALTVLKMRGAPKPLTAFEMRRAPKALTGIRGAPSAEGAEYGSQGPGRAQRARSPWIHLIERASPGGATDVRIADFCRPSRPGRPFYLIQGRRASRLPLATFCPRLRRSRGSRCALTVLKMRRAPKARNMVARGQGERSEPAAPGSV